MKWMWLLFAFRLLAWENHALPTSVAVGGMPELGFRVRAESLEDFLRSEQAGIAKLLEQEEGWGAEHVPGYPQRPLTLAFPAKSSGTENLKALFLQAIRVNPNISLVLFTQELPGSSGTSKAYWRPEQVSLLPNSLVETSKNFIRLESGADVLSVDVFISGTDEPDYGLDIGLWEDSHTVFGSLYHFGKQPFGNPKLEFGSQAPFHMGFYHEPRITYWAAGFLSRTLPEYRIHLYYVLSRFAFETGHDYWGWRFAGWGAHYIQDLTQPYHSTLLPGGNTAWILFAGLLDIFGIHGPKQNLVQRASDEHLALEDHMYCGLLQTLESHQKTPVWLALQPKHPESLRYEPEYIRDVLSYESYSLSEELAEVLPDHLNPKTSCAQQKFSSQAEQVLLRLMSNFGRHTRAWVRTVRH